MILDGVSPAVADGELEEDETEEAGDDGAQRRPGGYRIGTVEGTSRTDEEDDQHQGVPGPQSIAEGIGGLDRRTQVRSASVDGARVPFRVFYRDIRFITAEVRERTDNTDLSTSVTERGL